jgi:hypothetical protein
MRGAPRYGSRRRFRWLVALAIGLAAARQGVALSRHAYVVLDINAGRDSSDPAFIGILEAVDTNFDGSVTIDEITVAVNNALHGCSTPALPLETQLPRNGAGFRRAPSASG